MITRFKKFGLHIVEPNLRDLISKGFDVFVKEDNKNLILAILGKVGIQPQVSDVSGLLGYQNHTMSNDDFLKNPNSYVDAYEYIRHRGKQNLAVA